MLNLKRELLLKKMYNELSALAGVKPELFIESRAEGSCYFTVSNNCIRFNVPRIKALAARGFKNDYYDTRMKKLHFLKNNRKLMYRFVLLHELKHALQQKNNVLDKLPKGQREREADDYAIEKIEELGLLKEKNNQLKVNCFRCDKEGFLNNGFFLCNCGNKGFKKIAKI